MLFLYSCTRREIDLCPPRNQPYVYIYIISLQFMAYDRLGNNPIVIRLIFIVSLLRICFLPSKKQTERKWIGKAQTKSDTGWISKLRSIYLKKKIHIKTEAPYSSLLWAYSWNCTLTHDLTNHENIWNL